MWDYFNDTDSVVSEASSILVSSPAANANAVQVAYAQSINNIAANALSRFNQDEHDELAFQVNPDSESDTHESYHEQSSDDNDNDPPDEGPPPLMSILEPPPVSQATQHSIRNYFRQSLTLIDLTHEGDTNSLSSSSVEEG
jgi:hypothetical protein